MKSIWLLSLFLGVAIVAMVCLVTLTIDGMGVHIVATSKSAEWVDSECITRTVQTTQQPNEDKQVFCARHDSDVADDMERYGQKEQ